VKKDVLDPESYFCGVSQFDICDYEVYTI